MAKTFKELREAKRKSNFIGRSEHIGIFSSNLSSNEPNHLIFNITGQGGVGKSHLSNQYKTIADSNKCLTSYTDESIKSVLAWMESVSEQFKSKDAELTEFDKRYKVYLQETKNLESDPEKPKGTFASLTTTLTKGLIKEGKKWIPGSELVGSFINDEGLASTIGDWAEFARKKIANKDEVDLVINPIKVLTPLFFKDITKQANSHKFICFFIDTFEETDTILEKWLLEVLDSKYSDVPFNILWIIAGRDVLNTNKWSALSEFILHIPLEPFTEPETEDFLTMNGIFDKAVKADIIALSGRLPVLMDWLVFNAKNGTHNIEDVCETAVERFLKWIEDPLLRQIALDAALPRKVNQDIIECLLNENDKSQSKELFKWLCTQPFFQRKGDAWKYHDVVRDQMLRFIRTRSPKEWVKNHLSLCECYAELQKDLELPEEKQYSHTPWFEYEQERLYHALCAKPDRNIPIAITAWIREIYESGIDTSIVFGMTLKGCSSHLM